MSLPTPQERPDLYDYYDGLPEGHQSTIKLSDPTHLAQRIKERQAQLANTAQSAEPAPDKQPAS